MNPFDLNGPDFLKFYLLISIVLCFSSYYLIKKNELKLKIKNLDLSDPYKIAFLRNGISETISIYILCLIDRGLLTFDSVHLKSNGVLDNERSRPIERLIFSLCQKEIKISELIKNSDLVNLVNNYKTELEENGFLANDAIKKNRSSIIAPIAAILFGTSIFKIYLAILRNKSNFSFLIILTLLSAIFLQIMYSKRMTYLGEKIIKDYQTLLLHLASRIQNFKPGGLTNDLSIFASVYGLSLVPESVFPFSTFLKLNNKNIQQGNNFSSSSCSSSYGSSCGGSCGGGCGGCGS